MHVRGHGQSGIVVVYIVEQQPQKHPGRQTENVSGIHLMGLTFDNKWNISSHCKFTRLITRK